MVHDIKQISEGLFLIWYDEKIYYLSFSSEKVNMINTNKATVITYINSDYNNNKIAYVSNANRFIWFNTTTGTSAGKSIYVYFASQLRVKSAETCIHGVAKTKITESTLGQVAY